MKRAPEIITGVNRLDPSSNGKAASLVTELRRKVDADRMAMEPWMRRQKFWWRRLFGYEHRNIESPWVGASDFWYPMSDIHAQQVVAPIYGALMLGPQTCSMRPKNGQGDDLKVAADSAAEEMVRGHGITSIRGFKRKLSYALHDMVSMGAGIVRPTWTYESMLRTQCIYATQLPPPLDKLTVIPNLSDADRAGLLRGEPNALREYALKLGISLDDAMKTVALMNTPDITAWLGVPQPLNRAAFNQAAARIEQVVMAKYDLDMDEPADKKALKDIMAWMAAGFPNGKVEVLTREVLRNGPDWINVNRFDFWVPRGTRVDMTRAQRITERMILNSGQVQMLSEMHEWNEKATEACLAKSHATWGADYPSTRPTHEEEKGMGSQDFAKTQDLFELYYTWEMKDIHGTNTPEAVITIHSKGNDLMLSSYEDDSADGMIPHVALSLESRSDGLLDSRCVQEILRDPESYTSAMYRHLDNHLTQTNGPYFKVRKTAFLDPESFEPVPGGVVPVTRIDDFTIENAPVNSMPMERYAAMLAPMPEKLIGTVDVAATQNQRLFEPRTQLEVGSVIKTQQGMVAMRSDLVFDAVTLLLQRNYNALQNNAPKRWWTSITGQAPVHLTRAEIQGQWDLQLECSVGDMDPNYRRQNALQQFAMVQQLTADPRVAQDIRGEWDLSAAALEVLRWTDPAAMRRLYHQRPQKAQMEMAAAQQQQAQQMQAIRMLGEQMAQNIGATEAEWKAFMLEVKRISEWGELAKVDTAASAAKRQADLSALLMQLQGGAN